MVGTQPTAGKLLKHRANIRISTENYNPSRTAYPTYKIKGFQ